MRSAARLGARAGCGGGGVCGCAREEPVQSLCTQHSREQQGTAPAPLAPSSGSSQAGPPGKGSRESGRPMQSQQRSTLVPALFGTHAPPACGAHVIPRVTIAALAWWPWPLRSQVVRQPRNNGLVVYGHGSAVGLSALDPAIVLRHWVIWVSRLIVRAHAVHVQVPRAARASRVVNARIEGGTAVDACPFPQRTAHSCGQRP